LLASKGQEHSHTGGHSKKTIRKKHCSPVPELKNSSADCRSSRPAQCDGGSQQTQSPPSVIMAVHGSYDRRGHWCRHRQTERHDAPRGEQVTKGSGECPQPPPPPINSQARLQTS